MNAIARFLLLIAGLVFAASLFFVMLILAVRWLLRALWCKMTGKPLLPFAMRMNPRAGFDQFVRKAQGGDAQQAKPRRQVQDVTDVEPKL